MKIEFMSLNNKSHKRIISKLLSINLTLKKIKNHATFALIIFNLKIQNHKNFVFEKKDTSI